MVCAFAAYSQDRLRVRRSMDAQRHAVPRDFERPSYVTRWRRTGWLGRRDSNLCISKSDLLTFIPPQRVLGVDRARL
jgi:hypothetical protein